MTARPDRRLFLEPSPYDADEGNLIGHDPRQVPLAEIRLLEHAESAVKAIRAKCIDCSGNNAAEARKCVAVFCALWPFRMGVSPFHASSASSKRHQANIDTSNETDGQQNGPAEVAASPSHGPQSPEENR